MSIPAGVLAHRPSLSTTRQSETLVTRVPLAPFVALVLVDLLYAALGIGLTITALLAVMKGKAVRDATSSMKRGCLGG